MHFQSRSWFPFKTEKLVRAQHWFSRYGVWSLFFAWLPIVGDGLTFVAGLMKVRLWLFVVLVGLGKSLRYLAIIFVYQNV